MIERLSKCWREAAIIVAVAAVAWQFWEVKADAKDAKDISKQLTEIAAQNQKMITGLGDKLDVLFQLGHISRDMLEDLRMLPTEPLDSLGNPHEKWHLVGKDCVYLIEIPASCDAAISRIPKLE
jgi:hypothetical protein